MYKTTLCILGSLFISYIVQAQFDPDKIDIVRDKYGVPHIFAKTDPEVAFGLAWAHSEDDFATIQQMAMAGKALMGRYQGKQGAPIDYVVHLLRIPALVEEKYDTDLSEPFKKLLEDIVLDSMRMPLHTPKKFC
ncbi:MAG: penicillin acylase family protein [Spirosomataceae bacterium]